MTSDEELIAQYQTAAELATNDEAPAEVQAEATAEMIRLGRKVHDTYI